MKIYKYILLMLAAVLVCGCQNFDDTDVEPTSGAVVNSIEKMENGRFKVIGTLGSKSLTSLESRASSTSCEDVIYDGWCLVFGEDAEQHAITGSNVYTDDSPLIQIEPLTINADGTFFMIFDEYPNASFMRIVVNLTTRENTTLSALNSWRKTVYENEDSKGDFTVYEDDEQIIKTAFLTPPTVAEVGKYGIATFGQYRYQSVGLDGIYSVTYSTMAVLTEGMTPYYDLDNNLVDYGIVYTTDGSANTGTSTIHGLAETYNNNAPNPASVRDRFPMSSYGFVMDAINEEWLQAMFGTEVDMIRVCSKVQVQNDDSSFTMSDIYMCDAAQESRVRSTVMSSVSMDDEGVSTTSTEFVVPEDLGGTITYLPLAVTSTGATTSDPIYFYPNSGGDYVSDDVVNQDTNPQYIIIKGQASGYDTPGYYKVALKAQYPLTVDAADYPKTNTEHWSALTYDILRNTNFTVVIDNIDKPGYKTFDDAADENSPANNISYSLVIDSSNNRYEVLVSKGTYYAELETSRVYVKGYMDSGLEDCYVDFSMTPSAEGNYVPTVYVQASDFDDVYNTNAVEVQRCEVLRGGSGDWTTETPTIYTPADNETGDGLSSTITTIPSSDDVTYVRVYFTANDSGRLRLRIGDMLKFIPVTYDNAPISYKGTGEGNSVVVNGDHGVTWSDFSYTNDDDITYDTTYATDSAHYYDEDFKINPDGSVTYDNSGRYTVKPELRARISPSNAGDGNAVLYLRQSSDFKLVGDSGDILSDDDEDTPDYEVIFHSQSYVVENNTNGLFSGDVNDKSITFSIDDLASESVDSLTIDVKTVVTTVDKDGNDPGWASYFDESNDGKTITLSATTIPYDFEGCNLTGVESANHKSTRQAYVAAVEPTLVLYNNTATSVITISNVAGDTKTYTVKQIQYPPVYLVDASGQSVKTFNIKNSGTDGACVFALNVWNYDLVSNITTEYSVESFTISGTTYSLENGKTTAAGSTVYASDKMKQAVVKCEFDSDFISAYDWDSDTYSTTINGENLNGSTTSVTPKEVMNIGGYEAADFIYGLVRKNFSYTLGLLYDLQAPVIFIITITDKYGYTYTTTKYLYGTA